MTTSTHDSLGTPPQRPRRCRPITPPPPSSPLPANLPALLDSLVKSPCLPPPPISSLPFFEPSEPLGSSVVSDMLSKREIDWWMGGWLGARAYIVIPCRSAMANLETRMPLNSAASLARPGSYITQGKHAPWPPFVFPSRCVVRYLPFVLDLGSLREWLCSVNFAWFILCYEVSRVS